MFLTFDLWYPQISSIFFFSFLFSLSELTTQDTHIQFGSPENFRPSKGKDLRFHLSLCQNN